jgi:hypothetical protein
VALIQCLVQQFSEKTVTPGRPHAIGMKNVIRGALGIGLANLSEELA